MGSEEPVLLTRIWHYGKQATFHLRVCAHLCRSDNNHSRHAFAGQGTLTMVTMDKGQLPYLVEYCPSSADWAARRQRVSKHFVVLTYHTFYVVQRTIAVRIEEVDSGSTCITRCSRDVCDKKYTCRDTTLNSISLIYNRITMTKSLRQSHSVELRSFYC